MTLCFIGRHWWKDIEASNEASNKAQGRVCRHCSRKELYWKTYGSWESEWLSVSEVEKDLKKRKRGIW